MSTAIIRKCIVGLGLLLAILFGLQHWHASAYQQGHAAAVAERKQLDDAKLSKDRADALTQERALRATFDTTTTARLEKEKPHETALSDNRIAVRAGTMRLRAPVTAVCPYPAAANPAAAGRPGPEENPSLVPEAADNVLIVAAGSARDVRDYNAVVDLYNLARASCNAP